MNSKVYEDSLLQARKLFLESEVHIPTQYRFLHATGTQLIDLGYKGDFEANTLYEVNVTSSSVTKIQQSAAQRPNNRREDVKTLDHQPLPHAVSPCQ